MSLTYGHTAPLTGICAIALSISSLGAIFSIGICYGGTYYYGNYLLPSVGSVCNWQYTNINGQEICLEVPLTGTIGHSGDSYSIYDATSTLPVTSTLLPDGTPVLLINSGDTRYQHFIANIGQGTVGVTPTGGTALLSEALTFTNTPSAPSAGLTTQGMPMVSSTGSSILAPSATSTNTQSTTTGNGAGHRDGLERIGLALFSFYFLTSVLYGLYL